MAITFLNNLQFSQNQLLGARLQVVANDGDISGPVTGQIIYNSGVNKFKYYNGSNWIDPTTGSFTSWKLAGSTGGESTITDGSTATIAAGTGITTTSNASGTVTIAATGAGLMSSWSLSGDSGSDQSIQNGDTVKIAGGTNISTVASTEDTITVNLNDTITLAGDLTVTGGDITLGGTGRIQGVDTVTAGTDAANKTYVDNAVAGGLTFKDGFNANTGAIDGGGSLYSATRVAVAVGDYYVATTAGNFYSNASFPLDVGDSVIAKSAAAAGDSDVNDWVIIQGDEGVSTLSSGNSGSNSTGNAITNQTNQIGGVTVQSFAYNGGANVGHVPTGGTSSTFLRGDGSFVTPTDSGSGKRLQIKLNSALASITRAVAGGITTYTVAVDNSQLFGSNTDAQFIIADITTVATGARVFADVTNGALETAASGNLIIKFVGTIADSTFAVSLVSTTFVA